MTERATRLLAEGGEQRLDLGLARVGRCRGEKLRHLWQVMASHKSYPHTCIKTGQDLYISGRLRIEEKRYSIKITPQKATKWKINESVTGGYDNIYLGMSYRSYHTVLSFKELVL